MLSPLKFFLFEIARKNVGAKIRPHVKLLYFARSGYYISSEAAIVFRTK